MKKNKRTQAVYAWALAGLLIVTMAGCSHLEANENASVQRMTKEELKARLDNSDLIIIDVRSKRDWEGSDQKIPGAVRQNPSDKDLAWAAGYPKDKPMVLYCA